MAFVRLGAVASALISGALAVVVVVRDIGVNALNGWTIVLGLLAAVLALAAPRRPGVVTTAIVMVILAMLPAMVGGLGLLYVVPIILLALGVSRVNPSTMSSD